MDKVIGNCSKHPGQNFINCPLCEIERQKKLSKTFWNNVQKDVERVNPTPEGVTAAKDYEKEYVFAKLELAEAHKEIARLKDDVEELVECLDLIVGSMSLERVERFELNEKAKSLIQKHEQ